MQREISILKRRSWGDSPGGPVVKTPCLQSRGHGFDPWTGQLRSHMLLDTTSVGGEGMEPDVLWTWIQQTWFVSRIWWELFPKEALNWEVIEKGRMVQKGSVSSVQLLSHVQLFATAWTAAHQTSLSITNSWSFLKSCPSSWWCHLTVSSSVICFSSWLQSFPASGGKELTFPMSQFLASGGQSIEASNSASVLPMNIQDWNQNG